MANNELNATPDEIKKWNWGAFFLPGIWSIGNKVWVGLLSFIPFPLFWLIISFYLGAKGNELAWKAKNWESLEYFKKIQKNWAIAGLVVVGTSVLITSLLVLKAIFSIILAIRS